MFLIISYIDFSTHVISWQSEKSTQIECICWLAYRDLMQLMLQNSKWGKVCTYALKESIWTYMPMTQIWKIWAAIVAQNAGYFQGVSLLLHTHASS